MFVVNVEINKADYVKCNQYYLRRYFGVKEIILLCLLFAGGIALFFAFQQIFMLIMSGITLFLTVLLVVIFVALGKKQYKQEFVDRNTKLWTFTFSETEYSIETHENDGKDAYKEIREYDQVDRIAILEDKGIIYFYTSPATMYYIKKDNLPDGEFDKLISFMREKFNPMKFRMRQKKISQYPRNILGPKG